MARMADTAPATTQGGSPSIVLRSPDGDSIQQSGLASARCARDGPYTRPPETLQATQAHQATSPGQLSSPTAMAVAMADSTAMPLETPKNAALITSKGLQSPSDDTSTTSEYTACADSQAHRRRSSPGSSTSSTTTSDCLSSAVAGWIATLPPCGDDLDEEGYAAWVVAARSP